ncbi:lectin-like protein [Miscanthus floridulus]|uniref:lectin-like protein n=1 Tax=Miscanthus floridulus TaxID=154761 RepID=UPI0034585533
MVNKFGSVLLQCRFTMWRCVDNGSGSATAPRVQVMSFNSTFSINVFHLLDSSPWPDEGLTFVVASSRDKPSPGSYGGYLGLTNATHEANPTPARNHFVAVEFDTMKQDYDPSDNHVGLNVGSVMSVKTANLTVFRITTNSSNPTNYTP